jgi:hypothetical protein
MTVQHVQSIVKELSTNEDLRAKIVAAPSHEERKTLLEGAGLTMPNAEALKGADLSDVSGAGGSFPGFPGGGATASAAAVAAAA